MQFLSGKKSFNKETFIGLLTIGLITATAAVYAAQLNETFYEHFAPFYDSSSYFISLTGVLEAYQNSGIFSALKYAIEHSGTVTLLFIEIAFLAPFIEQPSRSLAPFLQLPWVFIFAASLFIYFHFFHKKSVLSSIALTIPFLGISAFWQYSAGLSDFRMDLPLYILLGTAFVWVLASRYTSDYWVWILAGLFLGLTCLTRATAPVYAILCLFLPLFLRLFFGTQPRRQTLTGILVLMLTSFIVSGWFFILKYEALYHYYFIWNTDANANLPLSESIMHLTLAIKNIGYHVIVIAFSFFFFGLFKSWSSFRNSKNFMGSSILCLDWESFWIGIAPIMFLVLRGAGLNPFVVMPSAFGLIMFIISPYLKIIKINSPKGSSDFQDQFPIGASFPEAILCITVFTMFTLSAITGVEHHVKPDQGYRFQNMQPLRSLIEIVAQDSSSRGEVFMTTSYISASLNDTALNNILKFDYPELDSTILFPSQAYPPETFNRIQSASDWEVTVGNNDSEKIDYLVKKANQSIDYIVLPDNQSIENIKPKLPYVIVNRYAGEIKSRLFASGNWYPIGNIEQVDHDEVVQVYRNQQRIP